MTEQDERDRAHWQRVCGVLDVALDAPAADRARIVAEHCGDDAGLRAEVEALLAAEATTDRRVDSPAMGWAGEVLGEDESGSVAPARSPGDAVGPYRLVRELGRGGTGAVWLAERADAGFEQQVALKLLKRGLDTDAIVARFLDERRILARLRHPHITLFMDGGVSEQGQPWFAMEWIDGQRITDWCDARRLGLRERVTLFLDVVGAVQYAHQQLVVHRDLKPGNVMVTADGQVKLLDFGIAKVLDVASASAEAATLTRMGWRMLTPEYAAPEQLRGEPAGTATDVYALGVLLYELLAGCRPPPAGERAAALRRPSGAIADAAAATRAGSVDRLRRVLHGDLDTIVLKALHAEPALRYGTALALGEDLQRWLQDQPVQARPDSAWYRARRFVARHRWGVAAAVIVAVSLAGGAMLALWQAGEARRQAQLAEEQTKEAEKQARRAEQAKDFLVKIVSQSDPYAWRDSKEPTVGEVLDAGARLVDEDLSQTPELHAEMLVALGNIYESRGQLDRAEGLIRRSLQERRDLFGEEHQAYADSLFQLSSVLYAKGDWKGSQAAATRAAAIFERTLGDHPSTAMAYEGMAYALGMGSDPEQAMKLQARALDIYRRTLGERDRRTATAEENLGLDLLDRGRNAEGKALLDHALETRKQVDGPRSLRYAMALNAYAVGLGILGEDERAARMYRQAIEIYREFGNHGLENAVGNLGFTNQKLGRFDEAERNLREAVALAHKGPKAGKRWEGHWLQGLADALLDSGRPDQAEPLMLQALGIMERDAGPEHEYLSESLYRMALLRLKQGRPEDAAKLAGRVDALLQRQFGPDDYRTALNLGLVARLRHAMGESAQGMELMESALRSLRRTRSREWVSTSSIAGYLAEMQLESGDAASAETGFRLQAEAFEAKGQRVKALRARMLRGAALSQLGRGDECEPLLRDVLSKRRSMYGDANAWTGEARLYLGICLLGRGQDAEGRRLVERGRVEFTRRFGSNHFVVRLADRPPGSR